MVGNAKNAGKTTVLNYLIKQYQNVAIAITSIGLDGEKIDQVTFLPKPRIFVHEGMLVATAKQCLLECEAEYEVLVTTNISTALGPIEIIRITKSGNCLIGGPSTLQAMKDLILDLNNFPCEKILIDGAFSRISLTQVCDATIFCVGAGYSSQIDKVVANAENTINLFQLPKYIEADKINKDTIIKIDNTGKSEALISSSTLDYGKEIISQIDSNTRYLSIPKAVSKSFIEAFINHRNDFKCDLIITSPTHLMVNDQLVKHLFLLKQKIFVLEPTNVVAVTLNPFSPTGYRFSEKEFQEKLAKKISLPIFNVLEKSC